MHAELNCSIIVGTEPPASFEATTTKIAHDFCYHTVIALLHPFPSDLVNFFPSSCLSSVALAGFDARVAIIAILGLLQVKQGAFIASPV